MAAGAPSRMKRGGKRDLAIGNPRPFAAALYIYEREHCIVTCDVLIEASVYINIAEVALTLLALLDDGPMNELGLPPGINCGESSTIIPRPSDRSTSQRHGIPDQ
jgi:hypothetical protein